MKSIWANMYDFNELVQCVGNKYLWSCLNDMNMCRSFIIFAIHHFCMNTHIFRIFKYFNKQIMSIYAVNDMNK